jgi:hypothetical protein
MILLLRAGSLTEWPEGIGGPAGSLTEAYRYVRTDVLQSVFLSG